MEAVKHMVELPVGRLLMRYSLPAIAGFLANALYQFVDRILVGRGVGTDAVAAVTSAFPLSMVAIALGLTVGTGTGNRIAVLLGQRDIAGAERVLGQGLRLAFFNGTGLLFVAWIFSKPILLASGCAPELLPMAIPFVRIISIGQVFFITLLSMGNILRVQGRPMLSLCIMLASNCLNVALATIAIYVLHWGVTGTALATALSQAAGCLTVLFIVQTKLSTLRIRKACMRADRALARSILTLGAPFGLMQLLGLVVFFAASRSAAHHAGMRGVATLGVLNTMAMMLLYPPLGVMQAMQPLLGYNKGAGRYDRVRAILIRALLCTVTMGIVFSVLVMLFSHPVASLFSRNDFELIALVEHGLPWFVFPITVFGISGTMSFYFLGVHEPRKAGTLMVGRQILVAPLFPLLTSWLGFYGLYLAGPSADLPFGVWAVVLMLRELRKLRALAANQKSAPTVLALGVS